MIEKLCDLAIGTVVHITRGNVHRIVRDDSPLGVLVGAALHLELRANCRLEVLDILAGSRSHRLELLGEILHAESLRSTRAGIEPHVRYVGVTTLADDDLLTR